MYRENKLTKHREVQTEGDLNRIMTQMEKD